MGCIPKSNPQFFYLNNKNFKLCNQLSFEKLDTRFCKFVLGIHSKASNVATRGELGRYPISVYIVKQCIKNWLRITQYKKETLLFDTYLCNLDMLSKNKNCWLLNIQDLVKNKLGAQHLWINQGCGNKKIHHKKC